MQRPLLATLLATAAAALVAGCSTTASVTTAGSVKQAVGGGEYGLGELRTGGAVAGYYRTATGSIGPQIGAQSKALVLLFMTPESLSRFRNAGTAWSVGADASVALLKVGANGEIDANVARSPTVAFVMTNAGLMADASLEATRISRID